MGDLYVHVRMKECCRATLKDLDKRKKKARFKGGPLGNKSLFDAFGDKTIDEARSALDGGGQEGGRLEELTRAACVKVCEKHAAEHDGKGETEEGAFWWDLAGACAAQPKAQGAPVEPRASDRLRAVRGGEHPARVGVHDVAQVVELPFRDGIGGGTVGRDRRQPS
jgi:hypothetical protein